MTETAPPEPDRPFQRRIDRIQRRVVTLAVLALLAVIPLAIHVGGGVEDSIRADGAKRAANLSEVDAVLLEDAERTPVPDAPSAHAFRAEASWQTSTGQTHEGMINASYGDKAGDTVSTWIDSSGNAAQSPETSGDAEVAGAMAGFGVIFGGFVLVGGSALVIRRRLNRIRMSEWDAQWARFEPLWSGRASA